MTSITQLISAREMGLHEPGQVQDRGRHIDLKRNKDTIVYIFKRSEIQE